MSCIGINDIRKRIKGIESKNNIMKENSGDMAFINAAKNICRNGRSADIINAIESSSRRSDINVPFSVYMELFDSLIEKGTPNQVRKTALFIEENIVQNTRDARSMQTILKRRITRAINKIKPKTGNALDSVKNSLPEPISPKIESSDLVSIYESMLDKVNTCINCDRVIENYNNISKRFNIDRLFYENTRINGVKDTVVELCSKIDTYAMPTSVKFNTVLETALYGFETNNIEYSKADILEAATDYFLFKEDGLYSIRNILDTTLFYDKKDMPKNMDVLMEDEPEEESVNESSNFGEMFKKFKMEESSKEDKHGTLNRFKSLISKLYSKDPDTIINETPDILSWVRTFFILSTGALPLIGPVLMIIGLISNKAITLHFEKEEANKMLKCFSNEIKKSEKKLETIDDNEKKERLKKYIDSLKDAEKKIDEYYIQLLTDEELEKKYDDDFSNGDINFEDDFFSEECNELYDELQHNESLKNDYTITPLDMQTVIDKIDDEEDINIIAKMACEYPTELFKDNLLTGIETNINETRLNNNISFIDKSARLNSLRLSKKLLENNIDRNDNIPMTISEAVLYTKVLNEVYEALSMIIDTENTSLLEASISNKLKLASMKLKNAFTKFSDKEKHISKTIDSSLNSMKRGVENALTNDNRESIIKGSILPSASKIIKLALIDAGLVLVGQPALAVIGTLGYLGCSAKFKSKERQMIIDEIEIELKMCQKYIDIAESKNDMKALKNLLMIQRNLERQHQRIKYKMKVELGQKYYDVKSADNYQ